MYFVKLLPAVLDEFLQEAVLVFPTLSNSPIFTFGGGYTTCLNIYNTYMYIKLQLTQYKIHCAPLHTYIYIYSHLYIYRQRDLVINVSAYL